MTQFLQQIKYVGKDTDRQTKRDLKERTKQ